MAPAASHADIKNSTPEGYLSRGLAMYNDKNYSGAIDQLTQLQMMPIDASMAECAQFYIALCKYERNDGESINALQQYIISHPSSANTDLAWATIGNHMFFAGKYGEAVRHYDKVRIEALDADTQEDTYYRRAYSLLRLGRLAWTLACFRALSVMAMPTLSIRLTSTMPPADTTKRSISSTA